MSGRHLPLASLLVVLMGSADGAELFSSDFNTPAAEDPARVVGPLGSFSATTSAPTVTAEANWLALGTIDGFQGSQTSGALVLTVDSSKAIGPWTAELVTGGIALDNIENDLGKLTLAFMLSASAPLPVTVRVESLDAAGNPSGALMGTIHPAAADYFQRFALDLGTLKPHGAGAFVATAPAVRLAFAIAGAADGSGWPAAGGNELRIDNLSFASPAFYVKPDGSDLADGRTATTAFATPQRALDAAGPGDIILLMEGTYGARGPEHPRHRPVAQFIRPGTPASWITLKNHPGHTPVISAATSTGVGIGLGSSEAPSDVRLGYLEVRGLTVRGDAQAVRARGPDAAESLPSLDLRGIDINAVFHTERTYHHLRIADCTIEYCTSDGLYIDYTDWFQVENNRIRDNCWYSRGFAPAGLSVMHFANFDVVDNTVKMLISGNRVDGNKLLRPNRKRGDNMVYFNGNGILLDANAEQVTFKPTADPKFFLGRTLVQNNLVVGNGGGGIQMWGNHRMDIVNNTLWHNGQTPELKWGNLGMDMCHDVRLINNVVVAQDDRPLDTWMANRVDRNTKDIYRAGNLWFGGAQPPTLGQGDVVADPLFVNPGLDLATADFRLRPGSPARLSGRALGYVPPADISGATRAIAPSRGAHQ